MSNIIVPDTFKGPVAGVFQGQDAGDDLSGGITGGYGLIKYRGKVWSIQHNGNTLTLMRDDGDGPRGSLDVVILKANPVLSKTYYENGWSEDNNNSPDCASVNGVVPDAGVPKRQSPTCATCPKNAWGSAPNGGKGKACGDHRRCAVVPLTDLRNETFGGPMLLRCPAASLQDMAAFDSRYKGMGYPYFTMGVKIGFDAAESYPKFTFQAIRPLTEEEGKIVLELRASDEVARVLCEGAAPVAPAAVAAPQGAFIEQVPEKTMAAATQPAATQQVQVQPAQPAPQPAAAAPAPTPVAQPAAAQANGGPAPSGTAAVAGTASGFGAAAPVVQPAAQQPAAAPQRAMTGFGAAQPAATQPVAAQAPQQAQQPVQQVATQPSVQPDATVQPAPGVVSELDGSIDERLNQLLGS